MEAVNDDDANVPPGSVAATLDLTDPSRPVVAVSGELDLDGAAVVRPVIGEALDAAPDQLVIDLSQLAFMDSSGIAVLLEAAARVERISLRNPSEATQLVIDATGLGSVLPLEGSVEP